MRTSLFVAALFTATTTVAFSADREPAPKLTPNTAEEPLATSFSMESAVAFLDRAALDWTRERKCFTCHTNYSYLLARPHAAETSAAHREVRESLETLVQTTWPEKGPRWDAEVVMAAAVLASHDAATTQALHPATRIALDRMWTVQREDGGFDWLKCDWPPMESDDHYGATMCAIAVGVAPDDYRSTDAARRGMQMLSAYFKANPPPTLHHAAMLVWADSYWDGDLIGKVDRREAVDRLLAAQKSDGGWALASLGDWQRSDGKDQDTVTSDGYGTGFAIYVLQRAGFSSDDQRLGNGMRWLRQNQRASGRWFTRSLNRDSKHFISHAGTAFAVMALTNH